MILELINKVIINISAKILTFVGASSTDRLVELIEQDLLRPESYLPIALKVAAIVVALIVIFKLVFKKEINKAKIFWIYIFTTYFAVLMGMTFFSREPGSIGGVDLEIFGAFNRSIYSKAFFVENVLMTVPLGFLLPKVFPIAKKGLVCVLIGMLISMCIEGAQFLTERGFCQLEDIFTNTLGTMFGWIFYYILHIVKSIIKKVKKGGSA